MRITEQSTVAVTAGPTNHQTTVKSLSTLPQHQVRIIQIVFFRLAVLQLLCSATAYYATSLVSETDPKRLFGYIPRNHFLIVFAFCAMCAFVITYMARTPRPRFEIVMAVAFGQIVFPLIMHVFGTSAENMFYSFLAGASVLLVAYACTFTPPYTALAYKTNLIYAVRFACFLCLCVGLSLFAYQPADIPEATQSVCFSVAYACFMVDRTMTLSDRCDRVLKEPARQQGWDNYTYHTSCVRRGTISMWMFVVETMRQITKTAR